MPTYLTTWYMRPRCRIVGISLFIIFLSILGSLYSPIHAQETNKGMLAIINNEGNLVIYDANGANPFKVTTDAVVDEHFYLWPTWATDGRLAFFGASANLADPYRLRAFVMDNVQSGSAYKTAFTSTEDSFTYSYWAPGDCKSVTGAGKCRVLALLYTPLNSNTLAVRLIRDDNGQFTNKIIGRAAPFYYSFSADGEKMLWHRNNAEMEIFDIEADKVIQKLTDAPGDFGTPMWSPVNNQLLFSVAGTKAETNDIVIADGDKRQTILTGQSSPLSFAWSPDGRRIASVSSFGKLTISDASSTSVPGTTPIIGEFSNVVAYFWSPQGDRIAYIVLNRDQSGMQARYKPNGRTADAGQQAQASLQWYVMDAKTGGSTALTGFLPTSEMVYYLNFFDQFSRSHSLWSPDGHYLAYGATVNNKPVVMLADTQKPGVSTTVADGNIGIWSWK